MKQVLLIRHGATAGNLQKRYIGRTDEPLCRQGIEQVQQLKKLGLHADVLFCSPARRARQTAAILFPQQKPILLAGLRESDFGCFEGKTAAEMSADPAYRAWVDSGCRSPIPGGESVSAFKQRCCDSFSLAMEQTAENSCAAFVIHGGSIMALLERYARPPRDFYAGQLKNGQYVHCAYDKGILIISGGALC